MSSTTVSSNTAMRNAGYADGGWTLMVQNYPSPLPTSTGFRYSQSGYARQNTGGCGFWNADADYTIGTILPTINNAVSTAISDYYVQESLHPNYRGQLALRSCLRQADNSGAPIGGTCTRSASGLLSGEPVMSLK